MMMMMMMALISGGPEERRQPQPGFGDGRVCSDMADQQIPSARPSNHSFLNKRKENGAATAPENIKLSIRLTSTFYCSESEIDELQKVMLCLES